MQGRLVIETAEHLAQDPVQVRVTVGIRRGLDLFHGSMEAILDIYLLFYLGGFPWHVLLEESSAADLFIKFLI
jgi:hypothetical protein